ncbi:hypothetical protein [Pedobacter nototheniae]|uniref:hypothetical protein n=1 Tax=Pedobacter nototheniae TaxID=2488994 RepID=UPI00292D20C3|nr:hypothetical protein [Pedobacter nototheniae]
MKSILFWLFIALVPRIAFSQTKITRTYPVKKGQNIELRFDYPKIVRISSWDKNEVLVEATVKINDGQSNQAFTLTDSSVDEKISIGNKLDMDQIPNDYFLVDHGIKTKFSTKEDLEKYKKEKGSSNVTTIYQQKDIEITIEIKVPSNVNTDIVSVYGMIELKDFDGPIKANAKYGGVDASLTEQKIGKIKLTNHYGKIYTDLNLKPTEQTDKNFFTSITASPGKGPDYDISSNYGNIYVRNRK